MRRKQVTVLKGVVATRDISNALDAIAGWIERDAAGWPMWLV